MTESTGATELSQALEAARTRAEAYVPPPHAHGPTCTTACPHYRPLDLWFHAGFCPRTISPDPKAPPLPCEGHALERPEDLRERSAAERAGRYVADE